MNQLLNKHLRRTDSLTFSGPTFPPFNEEVILEVFNRQLYSTVSRALSQFEFPKKVQMARLAHLGPYADK